MTWSVLGQIEAGRDFQTFEVPVIGDATIMLVHQTNLQQAIAVGYVTQYFNVPPPGAQVVPWRKIYSSEVSQLISLPVPPDFKLIGAEVWYLQFKARFPFYEVQWTVTAYQWLVG